MRLKLAGFFGISPDEYSLNLVLSLGVALLTSIILSLLVPPLYVASLIFIIMAAIVFFVFVKPSGIFLMIMFLFLNIFLLPSISHYMVFLFYLMFLYLIIETLLYHFSQTNTFPLVPNKILHPVLNAHILLFLIAGLSLLINQRLNSGSIFEVMRFLSLIFFIVVMDKNITSYRELRKIVIMLASITIFLSIYSYVVLYFKGLAAFANFGLITLRSYTTGLGNANAVATILSFGIPFIIANYIYGEHQRFRKMRLIGILFLLAIFALWNSRSSYLFVFVASLIIIGFSKNKWRYYLAILAAIVLVMSVLIRSGIFEILLRLDDGLTYRDSLWQAAWRLFRENPILGAGPDSFWHSKFYYMDPSIAKYHIGNPEIKVTAHNLLLHRAAELGIFGVLTMLYYWAYVVIQFFKNIKHIRNTKYFQYYVAIGAGFIALIFKQFFEAANNVVHLVFALLMFKIIALRFASKEYPPSTEL